MGKGILEMPPATVILTVNTTWNAALISRESALWVSPQSWRLLCQATLSSRVRPLLPPCCAVFTRFDLFLLKCLSLNVHTCGSMLYLRMSMLVTSGGGGGEPETLSLAQGY